VGLSLMTGDTSALGFDQDPKAKDYYSTAMAYLGGSASAKSLIDKVTKHGRDTYVLVAKDCFPMFCHYEMAAQHGFTGSVIVWDPVGLISARADLQCTFQSPAIALLHEIGHAVQWIDKASWYIANVNTAMGGGKGGDAAKLEIENDNIDTHETPVARELKEGTRANYNDALAGAQLAEARKYYKTPYPLLPLAHGAK
jgi:hypothetical protein